MKTISAQTASCERRIRPTAVAGRYRRRPGAWVWNDSMQASATASARRASTPVTDGLTAFADRGGELDELAGVGVAQQLGVAAGGVGARSRTR